MLLEGRFESFYALRLNAQLKDDPDFAFRESTDSGRMIVVSDADFIRNNTRAVEGGIAPLPLGWDRASQRVIYDNKEWLLNAVNCMWTTRPSQPPLPDIAFRLGRSPHPRAGNHVDPAAVGSPILLVLLLGLVLKPFAAVGGPESLNAP